MALYICNTPDGQMLVRAKTPVAAIQYAMGETGFTAEALSPDQLADWLAKGLAIKNAPEPLKRLHQAA
jgi:glycine/D-amino acid oxidase-like deaminating enzyme